MKAGPEHRDGRSVPGTAAAVLVVLLAALFHLLACAHEPASPTGADVRPAVAVVLTDAHGDSGQEPERHCCHADEPSIQAPRDPGPAAQPGHGHGQGHEAVPVGGSTAPCASPVRPGRSPGPAAYDSSAGRSLARLGVWRI